MTGSTIVSVASVLIGTDLGLAFNHHALLMQLQKQLFLCLQFLVAELDLVVKMPHTNINNNESNHNRRQQKVIYYERKQGRCDTQELTDCEGNEVENYQVNVEEKYTAYEEKHGAKGVLTCRDEDFYRNKHNDSLQHERAI